MADNKNRVEVMLETVDSGGYNKEEFVVRIIAPFVFEQSDDDGWEIMAEAVEHADRLGCNIIVSPDVMRALAVDADAEMPIRPAR